MRKVSTKRQKQLREYAMVRREYFDNNPYCEICGDSNIDLHHKNGRRGERLTDATYFMSVCSRDHRYIHDNPEESYEKGWLIKL